MRGATAAAGQRRSRAAMRLVGRFGVAMMAVAGSVLLAAIPAGADQHPANCNQNNLVLDVGKDKTLVRNGDTITYTVAASNLDSPQGPACDLTGVTITFTAPAADGTPTGAKTVLRPNVDFVVPTPRQVLGTIPYVVAVNPGVTDVVVKAEASGVLHDAPVNHSATVTKTLGTTSTQPQTVLQSTVTPASGTAPLPVTFTYTETNNSSTATPISGVTLTDDACAPVTYMSGDTNGNSILDVGETWTFTCARTITAAGTVTSHVVAHGTNTVDARAVPDEVAGTTVTVRAAPTPTPTPTPTVQGQQLQRQPPRQPALPVTGPDLPAGPLALLGCCLLAAGTALLVRARRARSGGHRPAGAVTVSTWASGRSARPPAR